MIRYVCTLTLMTLFVASCAREESPQKFTDRFYSAYEKWEFRGVPYPRHEKLYASYLGNEIIGVFEKVNRQREQWDKLFPYDSGNPTKPPWCSEGDIFCNVYEGFTSYSIGDSKQAGQYTIVEIHLNWNNNTWTDRLVLDRGQNEWFVADIQYEDEGSLLINLKEEMTHIAP